MPHCDGCGVQVDEAHIRRRIERLELATRFRPIHIQVLLLDAAPPPSLQDYFYRSAAAPDAPSRSANRSVASQMFFDEIAKCAGHKPGGTAEEDSILAEFQRAGFFLAYAVECPVEAADSLAGAVQRCAPGVVLRLNSSYKPKFVAPISHALEPLLPLLISKGWGERLILHEGKPFDDPFLGDPQHQAEFGTALGDRLRQALVRST
ncbi:MAG: hypothetical protein WA192_12160 [Candidatus Acidiferrales bacterium]